MIDLDVIKTLLPAFAQGFVKTVTLVALATALGTVLGFAANAARLLVGALPARLVALYVTVWRGTPFLAQLFVVYFGLPSTGLALEPLEAAVLALTLYAGAYFAEIFRGCWAALPAGQADAARALGISRLRSFIHLEAPQALRLSVPLLASQTILVLKESALASLITYPELTMTTGKIVAEQFVYVEPYVLLALSYWVLSLAIQTGARRLGSVGLSGGTR